MAGKKGQTNKGGDLVYVIAGKEPFLVSSECERLIESLLPDEEDRGVSLYEPDMLTADCAEVLDELRTKSFFAAKRVVVLKEADSFISANRGALERYFESPSENGVLVMTVSTWQGNTRLAKMLPTVGTLIKAGELKRQQLPGFLSNYAKQKYSLGFSAASANMLVELAGDEPGRLCSEVDKLAAYVGKKNSITSEDVQAVVGRNRMFGVFEVIDAMTAGDAGTAVSRLRNMFESDRSAEFKSVGAFAYHFRRMFEAKVMLENRVPANSIAGKLRIFYSIKDAFFRQLRSMSLEQIGEIIAELGRIDYLTKTGGTTTPAALERLVIELCARTSSSR